MCSWLAESDDYVVVPFDEWPEAGRPWPWTLEDDGDSYVWTSGAG